MKARVRVFVGGDCTHRRAFCKGCRDLLQGVDELGSLNAAAKRLGMAYSKAWGLLGEVEHALGMPLIEHDWAHGSSVTKFGRRMMGEYDKAMDACKEAVG